MFQIVNHEIPSDVIRKLQNVGKEFFELPQEEKELIAKPAGSDSIEGYGTKLQKEVNGKKGWVDHLFHTVWPPSSIDYRYWPKNPPSYSLEENQLKKVTNGDEMHYLLKINYYPPCPCPNLVLGVPTLTDMSYLTILVPNEVQGLQVCRDGHCMIRSNGKYKAVFHRTTVNKYETRMSWPVFIKPKKEHEVGPHPKLVNQDNPSKYKTKIYKDYAYCKLNKIPH
uniref:Fe2OG dioxygenase domain-containing protein n=1 Tax=Glycine max TaxID=3847 RepID=A0A0R0GRG3_SOYBN